MTNSAEITQSSITKVDDAEHKHELWWKFWTKGAAVSKDLKHHNIELVKVLGVIRGSEKPSIYVPANEPSRGQWLYVDVPAIVQHLGLPESTIYVEEINEDVNPSKPYPIPKELNSLISHSVMPRDHLNYVFTWVSYERKYLASVQLSVLVNRGWVPRSWRNKFLENSAEITESSITKVDGAEHKHEPWWKFWTKGAAVSKDLKHHNIELVKVLGVIRGSEKPSIYVPANEPSTGQWFYVDVPAIVQHLGLPESTIYVEEINEDVNPSKPYPIPKELNSFISHSVMPRDHLNYVFTWYSLSAAVTFMAIKRTLPKKSQR
ncbi:Surfeit locus protein 1 [Nymphaea thermarum]|nr:Surfeit locus protein 1 [Nymphaea thermarum]